MWIQPDLEDSHWDGQDRVGLTVFKVFSYQVHLVTHAFCHLWTIQTFPWCLPGARHVVILCLEWRDGVLKKTGVLK